MTTLGEAQPDRVVMVNGCFAILDGAALARLKRQQLLDADLPLCWQAQERLIAASL